MMNIPNQDDATSYYRAIGPFGRLKRELSDLHIIPFVPEWKWSTLSLCDIAFLQRPFLPQHLTMAQIAKNCGVPVWADYDDDLFSVPQDNPVFQTYGSEVIRKAVAEVTALADVVTVSTETLAAKLKPLNKNIHVIPNALDEHLPVFKREREPTPVQKLVFWRGTNTHQKDLMTVAPELIDTARAFPDVTFKFLGYNPWFITEQMGPKQAVVAPAIDIMEYLNFLKAVQPPLTIVPLHNSEFNRAKSNIAWLETTMAGSAVIAPNLPEFRQPGVITYDTSALFGAHLTAALKGDYDLTARNRISWEAIQENYTLRTVNPKRVEILRQLKELRG